MKLYNSDFSDSKFGIQKFLKADLGKVHNVSSQKESDTSSTKVQLNY